MRWDPELGFSSRGMAYAHGRSGVFDERSYTKCHLRPSWVAFRSRVPSDHYASHGVCAGTLSSAFLRGGWPTRTAGQGSSTRDRTQSVTYGPHGWRFALAFPVTITHHMGY